MNTRTSQQTKTAFLAMTGVIFLPLIPQILKLDGIILPGTIVAGLWVAAAILIVDCWVAETTHSTTTGSK